MPSKSKTIPKSTTASDKKIEKIKKKPMPKSIMTAVKSLHKSILKESPVAKTEIIRYLQFLFENDETPAEDMACIEKLELTEEYTDLCFEDYCDDHTLDMDAENSYGTKLYLVYDEMKKRHNYFQIPIKNLELATIWKNLGATVYYITYHLYSERLTPNYKRLGCQYRLSYEPFLDKNDQSDNMFAFVVFE